MKQLFFFFLFALGVIVLSACAWTSLQSLIQARLLLRIRSLSRRRHLPGEPAGPAALWGTLQLLQPLRDGNLWYRRVAQVYRRRRKGNDWVTESDEVQAAVFSVESEGRAFRVEEVPTEVQGTRKRIELLDEPLLGIFTRRGSRRIIHYWLPAGRRLTVAGRLEPGDRLVKDNKVGLLISPHEPDRAALIEFSKGVGGLIGVTAAVAAGLMAYYAKRGY